MLWKCCTVNKNVFRNRILKPNYCILFRYSVEVNLDKQVVNKDAFRDPALRRKARRESKMKFEEKFVLNRRIKHRLLCMLMDQQSTLLHF